MLGMVEIDADNRITATVAFDSNDIDAAFQELDARYLAGEAAALRTHVVGYHWRLRRFQSARTALDHTRFCRSSTTGRGQPSRRVS